MKTIEETGFSRTLVGLKLVDEEIVDELIEVSAGPSLG